MKYYVYWKNQYGTTLCHCFEQDEKQAKHFAKNVDGIVKYEY